MARFSIYTVRSPPGIIEQRWVESEDILDGVGWKCVVFLEILKIVDFFGNFKGLFQKYKLKYNHLYDLVRYISLTNKVLLG